MPGEKNEVTVLREEMHELAGHVLRVAKQVYPRNVAKHDMYGDEEYETGVDKMPLTEGTEGAPRAIEDPENYNDMMEKHNNGGAPLPPSGQPIARMPMDPNGMEPNGMDPNGMNGNGEEDYEHMDDDQMMMSYKQQIKRAYRRGLVKGYADAAQENADEHDAPFGEKDTDLGGGNEATNQAAGEQGGDSDDETFGPGGVAFRAMKKEMADLKAILSRIDGGQVIAKADAPAIGRIAKGQVRDDGQTPTVTRDMQEQAKNLSYRDLNRIREDMGDIPQFGVR